MPDIKLPPFLEQKLAQDRSHRRVVDDLIDQFAAWFSDSKMPFFPDYTDHGIEHLEGVLATACALIPEASESLFTPADAAILTMAVLFHDCAMHISEAGFYELIFGAAEKNYVEPFDCVTWRAIWDSFYFSARRWDDAKLIGVFGADDNGLPRAHVRDPFSCWNNLSEADRRLIGEFIRFYHARLAHEVAIFGVPGHCGIAIQPSQDLSLELRDIAGLVARSHNLPLRTCVDYLQGKYHRREYQGIHAVYLMALLRLGDYLQIQAARAPAIAFRYKFIPSNVSQIEFKAHNAVRNITATHDDPESLEIQAQPLEVSVFLRLKEWLSGIQSELDNAWAVIGEIYGSHPGLCKIGLNFRRIRSNLDDVKLFSSTVRYVPKRLRFDVARAELLKLLIKPLYGDDPSFGVRELMQNAIDAVRELEIFQINHPEIVSVARRNQEFDVIVSVSQSSLDGQRWLIVSDRGIGMTEDVIRDYFLRAGASFRQSDAWKAEFESHENANIKSTVLRSGRFGVGALGAFLIGDLIEVETRHVCSSSGFRFSTKLDSECIEVIRDSALAVGTSIKIRVSSEAFEKLRYSNENSIRPRGWDWFWDSNPTVARYFMGKRKRAFRSVDADGSLSHWRKLDAGMPYEILWTFDQVPSLICNGIFIANGRGIEKIPRSILQLKFDNHSWRFPSLSIKDPNGAFPLNLQRNDLTEASYPFGHELMVDVFREVIAWLFHCGPTSLTPMNGRNFLLTGMFGSHSITQGVFADRRGYGLRLGTLLNGQEIRAAIGLGVGVKLKKCAPDSILFFGGADDLFYDWTTIAFVDEDGKKSAPEFRALDCLVKGVSSAGKKDRNLSTPKGLVLECNEGPWQLTRSAAMGASEIEFDKIPESFDSMKGYKDRRERILSEFHFPPKTRIEIERWLVDDIWDELFAGQMLPFNKEERFNKFPKAVEILSKYDITLASARRSAGVDKGESNGFNVVDE